MTSEVILHHGNKFQILTQATIPLFLRQTLVLPLVLSGFASVSCTTSMSLFENRELPFHITSPKPYCI